MFKHNEILKKIVLMQHEIALMKKNIDDIFSKFSEVNDQNQEIYNMMEIFKEYRIDDMQTIERLLTENRLKEIIKKGMDEYKSEMEKPKLKKIEKKK